jgi:hypothetical protein
MILAMKIFMWDKSPWTGVERRSKSKFTSNDISGGKIKY